MSKKTRLLNCFELSKMDFSQLDTDKRFFDTYDPRCAISFLSAGHFTCLNSVFTLLMPPKKKPKSVTPTREPIKIPEPNNHLSTVLSKEAKDTLEHGILPSTTLIV